MAAGIAVGCSLGLVVGLVPLVGFAWMRSPRSRGLDLGSRVARRRPHAPPVEAVADGGDCRIEE
jgi:hypothetical protein